MKNKIDIDVIKGFILRELAQQPGADHAIKRSVIRRRMCDRVGVKIGDRNFRKIIESECPQICFNGKGYFIPADAAEVRRTVDRIESYIRGLAARRKAILTAYPDGRQMELGL